MKIEDLSGKDIAEAQINTHGHLPLAASYCRSINLVGMINDLVPSKMELKPGLAIQAMVLDTLSGRSPIYRLKDFIKECDSEVLLGQKVDARLFEDTNIGRVLDSIFKVGSSKILTALGTNAVKAFDLDVSVISYDTTSRNVWGEYVEDRSDVPKITYGYSKDHRPDLKQFMTELLCVKGGIPIFGSTLDGNSSDKKSNNEILTNISSIMAQNGLGSGAFVYVADSAMVSEKNLDAVGSNLFISRLPATYKECSNVINKAIDLDNWEHFGVLAETPSSKSRKQADYKGVETEVELYGKKYRAIVVHSSAHDARRKKRIERELKKSTSLIDKEIKKLSTLFACREDADLAIKKAVKTKSKLHFIEASIVEVESKMPGRPPKGKKSPTQLKYQLCFKVKTNETALGKLTKEAGCFVLITNTKPDDKMGLKPKDVLLTYKAQNGVERDFAFLKDPIIVNNIFLKKASRIDVLGMVFIIALMIWRLMERNMRAYVANTNEELPGLNNQKTKRPTSFMLSVLIKGVQTILTKSGERCFLKKPDQVTRSFLTALGLKSEAFLDPTMVCVPIIPINSGAKR